jgi:ubiquinone/menaquinone biosynthesis C-methylase UbiE/uncharacterized membrane protein YbhN (UPF0104 family)
MTRSFPRLIRVQVVLLLLGLGIAAVWVYLTGGSGYLSALQQIRPMYLVLLLTITAACLLVRYVRWYFLLRSLRIRVPARPSLAIYIGSLAGTATPAYLGEAVRAVLMRSRFGIPVRLTIALLVFERLLDAATLAGLGALTASGPTIRIIMAALAAAAAVAALAWMQLLPSAGIRPEGLRELRGWKMILQLIVLSLAAWVPAALLVSVAAAGVGVPVGGVASAQVFSTATLLGGVSLMPAGIATTGSSAIIQLTALGVSVPDSVVIVSLVRLMSAGVTLLIGSIVLIFQVRTLTTPATTDSREHFNEIANEYRRQFSSHVWSTLADRRISLIEQAAGPPHAAGVGLDLGCGFGEHRGALAQRGYRVVGVDAAVDLLQLARRRESMLSAGSALALPFRDASFNFVYTIGVLHHLPGEAAQEVAIQEVARVLKPGGIFIVQETNPHNLLFRFYMGYVFPILKSIDDGTEWWIEPARWAMADGMTLRTIRYFTFIPDFTPRALMRPSLALERRLEASRFQSRSVHYMAVLRKA